MTARDYDILVLGGGHAGCEAAAAAARMGARTALLTIDLDRLAQMSCNPAIGGLAKGQIVREIDAFGGIMARAADACGIQFRMLNKSKGPAVWGPRAQCDKAAYCVWMRAEMEGVANLDMFAELGEELIVDGGRVVGIRCASGSEYRASAVILTTGTFLRGLIHVGTEKTMGGRLGEPSAEKLSPSLEALGIRLGRLKTGTPPRLDVGSIDFGKLTEQPGDEPPIPFSFATERLDVEQIPCWITETNERTHEIIRANLDRAPLYSGQITGVGPRYCPSIEDKIVRFADKPRHQIYLEPEGRETRWIYANGIPTSLPIDVQGEMVHSIAGLERAEILQWGYAIEYDFAPPTQLKPSLETKAVERLYFAGQINGTSGYEEAGGQGLIAAVNAVRGLRGEPPVVLRRDQAYIGVMIDDLVTLGTNEPYRMFTSRAEHRLLLRADNADRRLTPLANDLNLVDVATWSRVLAKESQVVELHRRLNALRDGKQTFAQLLARPDITLAILDEMDSRLRLSTFSPAAREQVEIEALYAGYLPRQRKMVERLRRTEGRRVPDDLDYATVPSLRNEARNKFAEIRPATLGQAARIPGVTPADVAVLMIHLKHKGPGA